VLPARVTFQADFTHLKSPLERLRALLDHSDFQPIDLFQPPVEEVIADAFIAGSQIARSSNLGVKGAVAIGIHPEVHRDGIIVLKRIGPARFHSPKTSERLRKPEKNRRTSVRSRGGTRSADHHGFRVAVDQVPGALAIISWEGRADRGARRQSERCLPPAGLRNEEAGQKHE